MLNIKKIRPMSTGIVTTADKYIENKQQGSIILKTAGNVKEYQKVIAIGPMVRGIEVGDIVMINPARYVRKKFSSNSMREDMGAENPTISIDIPTIDIDGTEHFLIDQSDIGFVIEDYTEEEDPQPIKIEIPKKQIIL